jgi:hypothetical protein
MVSPLKSCYIIVKLLAKIPIVSLAKDVISNVSFSIVVTVLYQLAGLASGVMTLGYLLLLLDKRSRDSPIIQTIETFSTTVIARCLITSGQMPTIFSPAIPLFGGAPR